MRSLLLSDQAVHGPDPAGPFFILGCVRSGTTLLRNLLRLHPNLACPEETHFFRWPDPFGSEAYARALKNNELLKQHRQMDGIAEEEFEKLLATCDSKKSFCDRYMRLYIARNKPSANRWFDKTPQNVYGAALIASSLPEAKFVHIVRNPIDVVASLRLGRILKMERLVGACNYWIESTEIINTIRNAAPKRVHELRYEDLIQNPENALEDLLQFLGEEFNPAHFTSIPLIDTKQSGREILNEEDTRRIKLRCSEGMRKYGYLSAKA